MREKTIPIAIAAALLLGIGAAMARPTMAAPLVQECAPPGGVWGSGNTFRSKVQKFADNTAVYMSQNVSAPNKDRWFTSTPFPWSGGQITNGMGAQNTIVAEGDGYKVSSIGKATYYAHFSCTPAAPTARPAAPK